MKAAAADAAPLLEQLEEDGYTVLPAALTVASSDAARADLSSRLRVAVAAGEAGAFSKIQTPQNRRDLRLGMDDATRILLCSVVQKYAEVYRGLMPVEAELVELGVMTSHPGAAQQVAHSDVTYVEGAQEVYTTFVALQDIDASMGPTLVWPGTHTGYFCEFYKPRMLGPVDQYYVDNPPTRMTVGAGDAVLMDTRVMHCAGENRSSSDRMLFHFSFQTTHQDALPDGFTYHLLPELKGRFKLGDFLPVQQEEEASLKTDSAVPAVPSAGVPPKDIWEVIDFILSKEKVDAGGYHRSQRALDEVRSSRECELRAKSILAEWEGSSCVGASEFVWMAYLNEILQSYDRSKECWERALSAGAERQQCEYHLERISRELRAKQVRDERAATFDVGGQGVPAPAVREVERRDVSDLSILEFRQQYAQRGRPVIITGLGDALCEEPWTLDWLANNFGSKLVHCSRCVPDSLSWASLESHALMTIREFVDVIRSRREHEGVSSEHLYLFDISLPVHLREMLSYMAIPKYFAHDYLQRTPHDTPNRDSWPTLFIGPKGSQSALHVDQLHTNFYMILMEGRKRWVFFEPEDVPLLYPTWVRGQLDPSFQPLHLMLTDEAKPLAAAARRRECLLNAGEVLFVPAGTPHFVENLTDTVAVSGNFVDESNLPGVLKELYFTGLRNPAMKQLAEVLNSYEFEEPDIGHPLPADQMAVSYEELHNGTGFYLPR